MKNGSAKIKQIINSNNNNDNNNNNNNSNNNNNNNNKWLYCVKFHIVITATLLIPDALSNNSLSHFVMPDACYEIGYHCCGISKF